MTADDLASLIITTSQTSSEQEFHAFLQVHREQISYDVLRTIIITASNQSNKSIPLALQTAAVAEQVAEIVNTDEGWGLCLWIKGNLQYDSNQYRDALKSYQTAETYYREKNDLMRQTAMKVNQVGVFRDLGDNEAALETAEAGRKLCLEMGAEGRLFLANLNMNIGQVLDDIGRSDQALDMYSEARDIYKELENWGAQAKIDLNRAYIYEKKDLLHEAEALLEAARPVFVQEGFPRETARADLNLGRIAYRHGKYQEALSHLENAHEGFSEQGLPLEVANVNLLRSLVYQRLNLLKETISLAAEAETQFRRNGIRRERITTQINQGLGYLTIQQVDTAELFFNRARRALKTQGAVRELWQVDLYRASVALAQNKPSTAHRIATRVYGEISDTPFLSSQALIIRAQAAIDLQQWSKTEQLAVQALALSQSNQLNETAIQSLYLLSRASFSLNRPQDSWKYIQDALARSEQLAEWQSIDELHVGFLEDKRAVFEWAVELGHRLYLENQLPLSDLFVTLNRVQAAPLPLQHPAHQQKESDSLGRMRESWHALQEKIGTEQRRGQSAADLAGLLEELQTLETEMSDTMRREQLTESAVVAERAPVISSAEQIQAELAHDEGMIFFYEAQNALHAVLLTNAATHHVANPVQSRKLTRFMRAWRFHLQNDYALLDDRQRLKEQSLLHLSRLYGALWAKLAESIQSHRRIYLVVPPAWSDLPFGALWNGSSHVCEHHQLNYLTTAGQFLKVREVQSARSAAAHALVMSHSYKGLLKNTHLEGEAVTQTIADRFKPSYFAEQDATLRQWQAHAPNASLIHVASHAVFRPDNPLFSWIALADLQFTVLDLYQTPLKSRPSVVLSACETGRGQPRGGGLMGLARGFLSAGAQDLIVSLWRIEDQATAELMQQLYAQHEYDLSDSLTSAQRWAIQQGLLPGQWGGFIYWAG